MEYALDLSVSLSNKKKRVAALEDELEVLSTHLEHVRGFHRQEGVKVGRVLVLPRGHALDGDEDDDDNYEDDEAYAFFCDDDDHQGVDDDEHSYDYYSDCLDEDEGAAASSSATCKALKEERFFDCRADRDYEDTPILAQEDLKEEVPSDYDDTVADYQ